MAGGFRISLEGDEEVIRKLAGIGTIARREGARALKRSVETVKNRAVEGIANGPKTGRVYTTFFATSPYGGVYPWGSRPAHRASARGEYPASDTGNLMRSIWADIDEGLMNLDAAAMETQLNYNLNDLIEDAQGMSGEIGADAAYAAPLEYKPPEMGGRPFLRRALGESRDDVHQHFVDGLRGKFGQ